MVVAQHPPAGSMRLLEQRQGRASHRGSRRVWASRRIDTSRDTTGPLVSAPPEELAANAKAEASDTAPDSVDDAGNPVSYNAANLLDSDPSTAWRVEGSGQGAGVGIRLPAPAHITQVGLIPGYAKTDPASGKDRFGENRRIRAVRWRFSDGTVIGQRFHDRPTMQRTTVSPGDHPPIHNRDPPRLDADAGGVQRLLEWSSEIGRASTPPCGAGPARPSRCHPPHDGEAPHQPVARSLPHLAPIGWLSVAVGPERRWRGAPSGSGRCRPGWRRPGCRRWRPRRSPSRC
jgi:hypothetical protein